MAKINADEYFLCIGYLFSLQFLIFHLLTEWFQCFCVTFLCYFSFPAAWIWLVILDFGKPLIENINAWCSVKTNSILPLQTFIDWYKGKNLHTTQCYTELYRLHGPTADFLLFSKKKQLHVYRPIHVAYIVLSPMPGHPLFRLA